MKKWRIIPKISYINYKKDFPNMENNCFTKWFEVRRAWGGRLIYISVKARTIELDFRKDWLAEMTNGKVKIITG